MLSCRSRDFPTFGDIIIFFNLDKVKYGRKEYNSICGTIRELNKPSIIISDKAHLFLTNRMLWECDNIAGSICVDSEEPYPVEAGVSKVDYKVWDFQTDRAAEDDYAFMSGWCNSFNGEKFSPEELSEYVQDAYFKITPHISKESRLLEVGIGSGMIAWPLMPLCRQYDGCDFSGNVLNVIRKRVKKSGFHNVRLYEMSAHEISDIPCQYDCILMSSVTEYFSGYNYMKQVVESCIDRIDGQGNIFLLDIFDMHRLDDYKSDVAEYAWHHPKARYKRDFTHELYFPRDYWESLQAVVPGIKCVEVTDKLGVIENEINRYRYDVRIEVDKNTGTDKSKINKPQFGMMQDSVSLID